MKDQTGHITVSLWQNAAHLKITPGDVIAVHDVTLTYSQFHKTQTVSVNIPDEIKVCTVAIFFTQQHNNNRKVKRGVVLTCRGLTFPVCLQHAPRTSAGEEVLT